MQASSMIVLVLAGCAMAGCHVLNNAAGLANSVTLGTDYAPQRAGESLEECYQRTGLIPGYTRAQSLEVARKRGWE